MNLEATFAVFTAVGAAAGGGDRGGHQRFRGGDGRNSTVACYGDEDLPREMGLSFI